jgi:nitroimidazol reductase NimA-like FMN-containing flavoprotein (pyridoxamine 5'-phosphate oxidase superfamily)
VIDFKLRCLKMYTVLELNFIISYDRRDTHSYYILSSDYGEVISFQKDFFNICLDIDKKNHVNVVRKC